MIFAASLFLAQGTAAPAAGSGAGNPLYLFALMAVMMYFMIIRPQQRQAKEHKARLAALKTGDEVIAAGGIHGLVSNVAERTVTLKIADGVKIKVEKASVVTILSKPEEVPVVPTEVVPS